MEILNQTTAWYHDQVSTCQQKSLLYQRKSKEISFIRLLVFFVFLGLLITGLYLRSVALSGGTLLIFGAVFGKLIQVHNRIKARKKYFDLLVEINLNELKRLELKLHDFPQGDQFADHHHPYCLDLDLFGPHSLFQLVNRTITHSGAALLAKNMLNPISFQRLKERQLAVKELSESPAWCQDFLAAGMAFKGVEGNIEDLLNWVAAESSMPKWFKLALAILPLAAVVTTVGYLMGVLSGYLPLAVLVVNGLLLNRIKPLVDEVYNETHKSIGTLRSYEAMISRIESSNFTSAVLDKLKRSFIDGNEKASATIKELKDILSRVESRQNGLYFLFDVYLLLDIIWLIQAKSWKLKHGTYVNSWFKSISHYEVLLSLGLTAHNQANYRFPSPVATDYHFRASELGHPLIPADERINNNFEIQQKGTVIILTGSNMSGKSTFLRTIGVNTVLARLGAPVCAAEMELGQFHLFTSMRTTDSLEQHVSSFYAELNRIRKLITMLEQNAPTLYLLDELLKGTNSVDRNAGSAALIRQLRKGPSFGLISTHDLSLGELSEHFDNVLNFSFNSELKQGSLQFDYKLQKGLCKSFNASELMVQMGIDLENNCS